MLSPQAGRRRQAFFVSSKKTEGGKRDAGDRSSTVDLRLWKEIEGADEGKKGREEEGKERVK